VFLDEWKSVCLIGDALQAAAEQTSQGHSRSAPDFTGNSPT